MNHSHEHSHSGHSHFHSHHGQSFNAAFAISVSLNLAFMIFQVVYAFLANSMSLMADTMHNFGDVFGLILAWGANWMLSLSARKRYSYGFKTFNWHNTTSSLSHSSIGGISVFWIRMIDF